MKWSVINSLNEIDVTNPLVILYGTGQPDNVEWLNSFLSEDEKTYYRKFYNKTPLQCRALLRVLLSEYLKTAPESIQIRTTPKGKPYVADSHLFFNVSHSEAAYMIAICRTGRVGVDIEKLSGSEDLDAMADYAFTECEKKLCFSSQNSSQQFEKIWTLKEALLKALGTGLVNNLPELNVIEKLNQFKLNYISFTCPGNETASLVFREKNLPQIIYHWKCANFNDNL